MKLVKHIANLGYGSRKQVEWLFREGRITDANGDVLYADDKAPHEAIRIDGEPLDPAPGLVILLNKPLGMTCSHKEDGALVYDVLPDRWRRRARVRPRRARAQATQRARYPRRAPGTRTPRRSGGRTDAAQPPND